MTFKGQQIVQDSPQIKAGQIYKRMNTLIRIIQVVTGLNGSEPISCDVEFENGQITNMPMFMFTSGEYEYIGYIV